jgi:hypothetical protein
MKRHSGEIFPLIYKYNKNKELFMDYRMLAAQYQLCVNDRNFKSIRNLLLLTIKTVVSKKNLELSEITYLKNLGELFSNLDETTFNLRPEFATEVIEFTEFYLRKIAENDKCDESNIVFMAFDRESKDDATKVSKGEQRTERSSN